MSLMDRLRELFGRQAAHRSMLLQRYVDLHRAAAASEDPALHEQAAQAYRAYHRSYLTDPERRLMVADEEIARLLAENASLRARCCTCGGVS
ncbi:hypothetical protein MKK84_32930 [Methylobacterium sp. E-065]|uniref:hypothetical protein n=1 Tax=Methylobacterium sp. E-065 TaxID=2836583 RepID=UPI001FBAA5BA|nr:hypothetical protein [Methylobacterium sp. E-065]MCJ2022154.1 hypothetical protein [Methylobacterium sp. E-065]